VEKTGREGEEVTEEEDKKVTVRKGSDTRTGGTRSAELRNTKLGANGKPLWWQECVQVCATDTAVSLVKISQV
jgi:hypothetical protein